MRFSLTPEHHAALLRLAELPSVPPAEIRRLRDRFGETMSRRILAAAALQGKAQEKLGEGVWWVTERALQQATAWQVARVKASWFGREPVRDLCCGIGGDALQLACRGEVTAVDADPETAAMAEANLRHANLSQARSRRDAPASRHGASHSPASGSPASGSPASRSPVGGAAAEAPLQPAGARVICADVMTLEPDPDAALHLDPDRRAGGRASRPDRYQPDWADVWRLIQSSSGAAVKIAPAAQLDDSASAAGHRCWISLSGRVREQTLLLGSVAARAGAPAGGRSAVLCRTDGRWRHYRPNVPLEDAAPVTDQPRAVLVDPDAAIRAAGLTETLACEHQLECLGGPSGFLTGDDFPRGAAAGDEHAAPALAVCGRVLWYGPADDRKLRRQLRRLNVYPEVVKTRGTGHQPEALARRLRDCGERAATLWLGRAGSKVFAAVTERLRR